MSASQRLQLLDRMLTEAADLGLVLRTAGDVPLDGRSIELDGREIVNFGSCSYLGLETDERLRQGAVDALTRYGTQFSSSRTYLSAPPYEAAEDLLSELFGAPTMLASSTTLGHLSTLPVLVGETDAVVLDQQVHHSVQLATTHLRAQGTHVEVVRHNRMDLLEERVEELRRTHAAVWYMADGVYSMYADLAPAGELHAMLDRHEQLHLYVDDSHGMSWAGRHGRGEFLHRFGTHERLVLAASLNKAFAAAGAAIVFPHPELRRRVRTCGGPMIFSGPIQPPMLGALLASARIHLSPEIGVLQRDLLDRVRHFNALVKQRGLPLVSDSDAPIRCIALGLPRSAYAMGKRLLEDGFFVNVASFPAVPMKQAGIRVPLTRRHTQEDVEAVVESIAVHLPDVLAQVGSSVADVAERFGLDLPARAVHESPAASAGGSISLATGPAAGAAGGRPGRTTAAGLSLQHSTSIAALDRREWDRLLGDRGTFSAEGLRLLERVFQGNADPASNWDWHYFVVRDADGHPVLATFFTRALWKDDMLAPAVVSQRVERRRREDADFLTSYTLGMGSLLTEGDHLFLDRRRDWRGALALLFDGVAEQQRASGAPTVVLRDLPDGDEELERVLTANGFAKARLPDSHVLELDFATDEAFLDRLSYRARRHQRREVLDWEPMVRVEVLAESGRRPSAGELAHLDRLYRNVAERGLDLNTFPLPARLFEEMIEFPSWELVLLYVTQEAGGPSHGLPVAFGACFSGAEQYVPVVVGLDYDFVHSHHTYRQMLWQVVRRAREHGATRLLWGMGASLEKRRFGARPERRCAYFQASDHYSLAVMELVEAEARLAGA